MRRPASVHLLPVAFAYAGGVVLYLPLLALLLPLRIERMAADARFGVLAVMLMAGGVAAAAANILFGWASDGARARSGGRGRRRWLAAGLAATGLAYLLVALAPRPVPLAGAIILFQLAVNMALAPLVALAAEEVADRDKGLLGGLLAAGHGAAAALCPLLAAWGPTGFGARLLLLYLLAVACMLPLLCRPAPPVAPAACPARGAVRDLAIAWGARLLVQIAGGVLFSYLLYIMEGLVPAADGAALPTRVGALITLANLLPLPAAVLLGRWSDRVGRRKPFLVAAALLAAGGLAGMALADGLLGAVLAFALYAVGWGSFLPLQVGFVMELLPDPAHRGRDLGLFNLANTLPALIGPGLAWSLASPHHPQPLLWALAGVVLAGGMLSLGVRGRR